MGMSPLPGEGYEDRNLTDAGGRPVGALPGACAFDSAFSFGIIRGGHLDVTVNRLTRSLCHLAELCALVTDVGDLVRHDQVVPRVDGRLDVVAHDARALA